MNLSRSMLAIGACGASLAALPSAASAALEPIAGTGRIHYGTGKDASCRIEVKMLRDGNRVRGWVDRNCLGSWLIQLQRNDAAVPSTIANADGYTAFTESFDQGAAGTRWRVCVISRANGCSGDYVVPGAPAK